MFKFHKLSLGNLQTRKKTCFAFSYSFLHIYFFALQSVCIHLGQLRGNEEGGREKGAQVSGNLLAKIATVLRVSPSPSLSPF